MPRTALVTGAYGYLGSRIRAGMDSDGWRTIALARRPRAGDRGLPWSLGDPLPEAAGDAQALVHCAYDMAVRTEADVWLTNVGGSTALLESARRAGVDRCLVLSSMSAYSGTAQRYGRAKLAIEAATLEVGGIAIRPGLVYGDESGGMTGTLRRLTRLPIVPVPAGRARQFPVHETDLVDTVVALLGRPEWIPDVFGVAQPDPVPFADVLRYLARRDGRRCRVLPIPSGVVHGALRAIERLGLNPPVRSDSLAGLLRPAPEVRPAISGRPPRDDPFTTMEAWSRGSARRHPSLHRTKLGGVPR